MVSTVHEARRAADAGADIVVAQGSEGGGHVGLIGSMVLVPQVVRAVAPLPVLAAGGIADGAGLAAALMLGAEGVLLGTRFLATPEAPLPDAYKEAICRSDGHDTLLSELPDVIAGQVWPGAFARALRTPFIQEWLGREGGSVVTRAQRRRRIDRRLWGQRRRDEGFECPAGGGNFDVSALQGAMHGRGNSLAAAKKSRRIVRHSCYTRMHDPPNASFGMF